MKLEISPTCNACGAAFRPFDQEFCETCTQDLVDAWESLSSKGVSEARAQELRSQPEMIDILPALKDEAEYV